MKQRRKRQECVIIDKDGEVQEAPNISAAFDVARTLGYGASYPTFRRKMISERVVICGDSTVRFMKDVSLKTVLCSK